jgi:hypothetical protein
MLSTVHVGGIWKLHVKRVSWKERNHLGGLEVGVVTISNRLKKIDVVLFSGLNWLCIGFSVK